MPAMPKISTMTSFLPGGIATNFGNEIATGKINVFSVDAETSSDIPVYNTTLLNFEKACFLACLIGFAVARDTILTSEAYFLTPEFMGQTVADAVSLNDFYYWQMSSVSDYKKGRSGSITAVSAVVLNGDNAEGDYTANCLVVIFSDFETLWAAKAFSGFISSFHVKENWLDRPFSGYAAT